MRLPRRRGRKIDRRKAAPWPAPPGEGDTIWMGAADASGLVVSYIQSLYWEFGSGVVLPQTGVLMQNRGTSFSLDRGALNLLAPGRLPLAHAQSGAGACSRRPRHGLRHHGRRRASRRSRRELFTRHVLYGQPLDVALDRAALADRPHLGLGARQPLVENRLRRQSDRPACRRPAMT